MTTPHWAAWDWQFVAVSPGVSRRVGEICAHGGAWWVRVSGARQPDGTVSPPRRRGPYRTQAQAEAIARQWAQIREEPR